MLNEKFNDKTKEFECYCDTLKFITFTGYGETKNYAMVDYFRKQPVIIKSILITDPVA